MTRFTVVENPQPLGSPMQQVVDLHQPSPRVLVSTVDARIAAWVAVALEDAACLPAVFDVDAEPSQEPF